ncbi:MAG: hypothetical protein A2X94_03220 [Bdellovibrionales bacterium GWB1_55_8]|nr:MAG: hypothetical protein A2X94_03220 [Bdellovibrionales bacterium GWB1_55_8]
MSISPDFTRLAVHRVFIFLTVVAVSLVSHANADGPKPCAQPGLATWVAEWGIPSQLSPQLSQLHRYSAVWTRDLAFHSSSRSFHQVPSSVLTEVHRELKKTPDVCRGPVLHNATGKGFDASLGLEILKMPDPAFSQLAELVKQQGWNVLQVDLESLPETAAEDFEKWLARLIKSLEPQSIRISVVLHAKTSLPGDYEGARFQRWDKLAALPVDFVVMAYDYHWSTSAPGPIAPFHWVEKVAQLSKATFSMDRLFLALPVYGYHWKKKPGKTVTWSGRPELAPALAKLTSAKRWKAIQLKDSADGMARSRGLDEKSYWDDGKSAADKIQRLRKLGYEKFALWRWGGDPEALALTPFQVRQ